MQVFVCIGILSAYAVGWPYAKGSAIVVTVAGMAISWWRIMFAVGLLPAVTQARTVLAYCKLQVAQERYLSALELHY